MSWREDAIADQGGYGIHYGPDGQPHVRVTIQPPSRIQRFEPVDRGIGATPPAQPSKSDLFERAKAEARNRLRAGMSNHDAKEDGYYEVYRTAHDARMPNTPMAQLGEFGDAFVGGVPFADESSSVAAAGLDYLSGRTEDFGDSYRRYQNANREKRESYSYRHPGRAWIADRATTVLMPPLRTGRYAKDIMEGATVGAIQGFSNGDGFLDRLDKTWQGAVWGAAEGAGLRTLLRLRQAVKRRYHR
jgi:hypothetical protein